MNQTVKWLFVEEQGNSVVFRCSVCNSEIIVQYGEELPYCKHCESEPDGEQIAKKMTDNEIIKAWECCMDEMGCTKGCPCFNPKAKGSHCTVAKKLELEKLTLDLINRQKAEIEKLQTYITNHPYRVVMGTADIYTETHEEYEKLLTKISAEAVKECLDKIEQMDVSESDNYIMVKKIEFDNLVKEMVGENNANRNKF